MDGRVRLYKRKRSRFWQCYTHIDNMPFRESTKEDLLSAAKVFAREWYFRLLGKSHIGELTRGTSFREAAAQFRREYEVITEGQRNPDYVKRHWQRLDKYLLPFFGDMIVSEVTAGKVQEYRVYRLTPPEESATSSENSADKWSRPARSTLHQEIVVIRQVLKTAQRHGWLAAVPNVSPPFKSSEKIGHRAWFSPDEYRQLYEATRLRTKHPKPPFKKRWKWEAEQLHDYVLFMANTGLRPDEAARLEYRDVKIVRDKATREVILEIEARGKRGVGHCKSTPRAVTPFRRLLKRNDPMPSDRVFPKSHREMFNAILDELNLKVDRDGNRRTAYSLRHTYICLRLMQGADIYQIAKNCRTSVEMIQKHYAVHLKDTLDAAMINVRAPRAHQRRKPARPKTRRRGRTIPVG